MQTPDNPSNSPESTADSLGQASPEAKAEPRSSGFLAKVKTLLSALLLIAISGGIGYGVGLLQGNIKVKQVREEKAAALAEVDSQVSDANDKVAAAEARSAYSQVQLLLLESIDELEQSNFGNANNQLRLASETLNKIEISKNPDILVELKEELSNAEINFAVNPVEQRKLILGYTEKIEGLLPD